MIYLFDNNVKEQLTKLREYAEKNIWTQKRVNNQINGTEKPPGDYPEYNALLWGSIKVVFTVSENHDGKHYRLMSISNQDEPTKSVHVSLVEQIILELGYTNRLPQCMVLQEKIDDEGTFVVKIVESFD